MAIVQKKDLQNRVPGIALAGLLTLVVSACAGTVKNMSEVPASQVSASPAAGKSMVVFMRPSSLGFAVQSSVFEVQDDNVALVGIVAAKKKVAYELDPGEHLFMVVGEAADFMSAELEADRTYYALVTPRPGAWKARFSLKPIHSAQLDTAQFREWFEDCAWVEKSPASEQWATSNMASVREKQDEYFPKWMSKEPAERPRLLGQDGRLKSDSVGQ